MQLMDTHTAAEGPLAMEDAAGQVEAAATATTATLLPPTPPPQQPQPPSPTILERSPVNLPTQQEYTQEQLEARYGLSTQEGGVPEQLKAALALFGHWCCTAIQLNRPANMAPLAPSTWENVEKEVGRFLGFCVLHAGVERPCLHHCLNAMLVVRCIRFLRDRGVGPQQLYDMVGNMMRVCTYLHATQQLQHLPPRLVAGYQHWLSNLHTQLSRLPATPKPSMEELEEEGKWLHAEVLLACMCKVHSAAVALVEQAGPDAEPEFDTAVQVMHAAMCCFIFGFVPPLRPSIVISLQLPGYEGPCCWAGCNIQGCQGNRLEWVAASSSSSSSSSGGGRALRLVAPHHKNSSRAQTQLLTYILPPEITCLLEYHISIGRGIMLAERRRGRGMAESVNGRLFCNKVGGPVGKYCMSTIWNRTVLPQGVTLPPRVARSVHVTGVRTAAAAAAAATNGAQAFEAGGTFAMGNSLAMWDRVYDRGHSGRQVHKAIDLLRGARGEVMAKLSQQQQQEPQPAVQVAASAAAAARVEGPTAAVLRRRAKRSRQAAVSPVSLGESPGVTPGVTPLVSPSSSSAAAAAATTAPPAAPAGTVLQQYRAHAVDAGAAIDTDASDCDSEVWKERVDLSCLSD
jgi:hypothetical protein